MSGSQNAGPTPAQIMQIDRNIQDAILAQAVEVTQQIAAFTFTPNGSNNILNIPMQAVGITKGFIVECTGTVTNGGTGTPALTNWNAANFLTNVTVTDLDNYQRVNTGGIHLSMLNSSKEGWPFAGALLNTAQDNPVKFGSNVAVLGATALTGSGGGTPSGSVTMKYWVPLAYSKRDLRGMLYTGVTNATAYLGMTVNPNPGVTTSDPTFAIYSGANTAITFGSVTIKIYQVYLDQLPRFPPGSPNAGNPILPPLARITQYRLNQTSLSAITAGQDFPIPFSNFQQFLSLGIIYDQAGTTNPATDINYFAVQAANTYTFFKYDPFVQAMKQRLRIKTDFPVGSYVFDFRDQPIETNQSGNMQLIINPITAAAGSNVFAYFEAFAVTNSVLGAQSLPAS